MTKRTWIAILIFVLYLACVAGLAFALHFSGSRLLLFCLILGLLGAATLVAVLWYQRKMTPAAPTGDTSALDTSNLDALLRDAERKLREGSRAAGGSAPRSLASMPLLYVVGGENSAKTQSVLQSGLDPELLAGQLYRDGVLAPTQLANIWLAGSVIVVEAAGALLRQPALWLRLVRATRPGKLGSALSRNSLQPTRAVVLCVSVERLQAPHTADSIRTLAQTLNERLRQLSQTLGISLPVYVLFTKLDTIAPFADYATRLTPEEVKAPIGSLLPRVEAGAGLYAERASTQVASSFDQLLYALAEFRLELLARGGELPALARAYEFPRELRKLRPGIVDLLVELARPSQLGINPFLRGFFFTGVRAHLVEDLAVASLPQAPTPAFSPADAGATRVFSIASAQQPLPTPQPARSGTRKVPQWVFLPHLFSTLLLSDKSALDTSRASSRVNILKRTLLAALSACILLYLLLLTISFFNNRSLEHRVLQAASAPLSAPSPGQLASVSQLQTLDQLRTVLLELDGYRKDGPPLMDRWGLYSGDALYPIACNAYASRFRTVLLNPTQANILARLRAVQSPPSPDADYNATYKPLKAYLITTSNPEKSTSDFLPPVLSAEWAGSASPSPDQARLAQSQFELYSTLLPQPHSCMVPVGGPPEIAGVNHARDYLNRFGGFQHVYQSMIAAAAHKVPSLRYNDKFPGSARFIVDNYEVPGAYTRNGFAFMQDAIQHPDPYFSGEEWVLGPQSASTVDRVILPGQLQKQYVADYLHTWRTYLTSARFVGYQNLPDAAAKLSSLDSNVSPMLELFSLISLNTGVALPEIANAFQAPQSVVPPTNPENRYTAAANQPYIAALQALEQSIKNVSQNPMTANDPAAATPIIQSAGAADQAAENLRNGFTPDPEGRMDSTSFALLQAPIQSANALAAKAPAAAAGGGAKNFCAQIAPILSKFPFNPQSQTDASTEEVAQVFAPGQGALAQFYTKTLSQLLILQGNQYVPAPGSNIPINPAFLAFFNAAQKISSTLYAAGNQPSLNFSLTEVKAPGVPDAVLTVDGQQIAAAGQSASFHWVSQPTSRITLISEQNTAPTMTGPWSVFHLGFSATHPTPNHLEFRFQFNGQTNQVVRFDSDGPGAPLLDPHFMSRLHCVATVAR